MRVAVLTSPFAPTAAYRHAVYPGADNVIMRKNWPSLWTSWRQSRTWNRRSPHSSPAGTGLACNLGAGQPQRGRELGGGAASFGSNLGLKMGESRLVAGRYCLGQWVGGCHRQQNQFGMALIEEGLKNITTFITTDYKVSNTSWNDLARKKCGKSIILFKSIISKAFLRPFHGTRYVEQTTTLK